jgi:L-ascorbate metabolism protein UlaG (beta-lactamase superfamily)
MRATLVGHACWLFETTAGCFLMDPVLFDPFEEGTVTSCPRRAVRLERLPALQGIVISHRHLDHFDLPSLAVLDRRVPVFCPDDPFLLYGLQRLGFGDIRRLAPFVAQQIGGLRLLPTPSLNRDVLEYGLVVQDETGALFNQVDTFLAADTIQRLHGEVDQLDVHLAMYASQHFDLFESKRASTAAMHGINLHTASRLAASCVVPAAAGFRFTDDLAWLNRHVFPISPARFVQDLRQVSPTLRIVEVNPGDTLVVASGQVDVHRQAVAYVLMLENDTHRIAYDASAPIPALEDRNRAGYGLRGLREFVQGVVEVGLPQSLARGIATREQVAMQYLRYGVVYQVIVVFPNSVHRSWTYRFDRQRQTVQRVSDEAMPDVRKCITASALVDFCLGRRSYFAVRTQSRRSVQVYDVMHTAPGVVAQAVDLPDLLTHYILNEMAGAERRGRDWIDFVTKDLRDGSASPC